MKNGNRRRDRWAREAEQALLDLCRTTKYKRKFATAGNRPGHIWDELATEMEKVYGWRKSGENCYQKWKNWEKGYRRWKKDSETIGLGSRKIPWWYEHLAEFLDTKASVLAASLALTGALDSSSSMHHTSLGATMAGLG